jgi:WD40 repeat protein
MQHRVLAIALLLIPLSFASAQDTKRWPIPSQAAQAKIENLLQELYKDDLAKAGNDPSLRRRLAQTLLFEGKETKDDAAGRYVLFSKAQTLAAQAGDVNTALQAADELAQGFLIPAGTIFKMKIQMLKQASQVEGAPPDAYQAVIDRAMLILDDTLDGDDYPSSLELIAAAEQAGRKLRSIVLVASIRRKQDEIVRLHKEFARWQPFADKLAKNPNDPEANEAMGKYQALVKGNWERGLPMLAQGSKGKLTKQARDDLQGANSRSIGLGWYRYAITSTDKAVKTQALLRAYHWFQESLNGASDVERSQIDALLREIADALPPEYRIGEIKSELKRVDLPSGPVYGCAFSPEGKRFITTGYDGALHLFNARTFKEFRQLDGHVGKVWTVAFAGDGQHAVSGGFDGTVRLWDLNLGRTIKTFEGHRDYVRSVAISDDGKWILSGGDDRTVRLWNAQTGKEERVMPGHDHTVWCVALSRDGKRALSASLDKTVRYWDTEKGETIKVLEGHKDTVLCVAFTPDGRHAITGSTDKAMRWWDLAAGLAKTFPATNGYIHSVAISPDGRRVLSAGQDGVVRLWDVATGQEVRQLEGHRDQVWHVAFSRDGRFAISSGQDNCVRLWAGAR